MQAAQLLFAETLLHELAVSMLYEHTGTSTNPLQHALFVAMTVDGDRRDRHLLCGEAYHGDEAFRELGWSMSNSVSHSTTSREHANQRRVVLWSFLVLWTSAAGLRHSYKALAYPV